MTYDISRDVSKLFFLQPQAAYRYGRIDLVDLAGQAYEIKFTHLKGQTCQGRLIDSTD